MKLSKNILHLSFSLSYQSLLFGEKWKKLQKCWEGEVGRQSPPFPSRPFTYKIFLFDDFWKISTKISQFHHEFKFVSGDSIQDWVVRIWWISRPLTAGHVSSYPHECRKVEWTTRDWVLHPCLALIHSHLKCLTPFSLLDLERKIDCKQPGVNPRDNR